MKVGFVNLNYYTKMNKLFLTGEAIYNIQKQGKIELNEK